MTAPTSALPDDAAIDSRLAGECTADDFPSLVALTASLAGSGRARLALRVAERAVELADRAEDPRMRVSALRARARAQSELTEYTDAVHSLLQAQGENQVPGDSNEECQILSGLGLAYGKLGMRTEAIEAHESALSLARQGPPGNLVECYSNLGVTLINCERPDEAVVYLQRALELDTGAARPAGRSRAALSLNAARLVVAEARLRQDTTGRPPQRNCMPSSPTARQVWPSAAKPARPPSSISFSSTSGLRIATWAISRPPCRASSA